MKDDGARRTLVGLALVLGVLGVLVGSSRLFPASGSALVGREAPALSLSLVANGGALGGDGALLDVSRLRGHAVVLDFWATWCRYCLEEAPVLDRIAQRWSDKGVVVVGVGTDRPGEGDPGEFARTHGMTFPIVGDPEGTAMRAYGVDGLPTLVVVSSRGEVVAVRMGATDGDEIERLISRAL